MKVAVFGIGLIGGSLAIDLKKRGFASEIIGVSRTEKSAGYMVVRRWLLCALLVDR